MRTDYLGLEAFVAIAELGSFNRAAAYLNLSQTALSHRIRKIETDLGIQLLIRSTRDVLLTKEGQALLPQVQRNLANISEAYDGLRKRGRSRQDRLAFACLPTIANYYLPTILRQFSQECPDIAVQLHDQPVGRIYELVQVGEVEFGISIIGAKHWDLDIREIVTEPYVVLVHRAHPLARQKSVTRGDLAGLPFVRINTQSTNRQLVHDALGEHGNAIDWRYEVQTAAMAMSLVAEGVALTVLPALTANLSGGDLVGLEFSDVEISRTLGVATRRGWPLSKQSQRLLTMITERLSRT
ncbi:MAG: LysR family transcriptional regulator [Rhodomicrobiaceae bacterium]